MSEDNWWLISNRYGGIHRTWAADAKAAKASVRDNIAEAFLENGLSASAARRAASSYAVWLVAGPITHEQAVEAMEAWDRDNDLEPAARLASPKVRARLTPGRKMTKPYGI